MLKPTSISPLSTSYQLFYRCEKCKKEGVFNVTLFNVNQEGMPEDAEVLKHHICENCHGALSPDDRV